MRETRPMGQQAVAQVFSAHDFVILNKAQKLPNEFKLFLLSIDEFEAGIGVKNE
ncbi:MAG: hypothetical protein KKE44_01675 [Proteobacteria bacterium]|nr:hypothetical protein [Pseudomonadota bacterium]MBU1581437.1 hypothetical protein [Pseudomonadota bacterium]MBU2454832.1 hypothetical protein [Pseudomonadota bacterium]